ncbi:polyketide cyclase / dehydrase and lipid transport [Rhodococcus sp. Leaf7]|uniref:hypothetical protein n=1 Tax=unclassified Rhodococcus (in: high G+C Gram-positive bacteria) TaxID=192944 RepID=UPI0005AD0495|nr:MULTISPECIES: hypothetical protein [unclassified Rhodococcus (in: high G+C Gram-positive bacteria)]KIQ16195.1 polyketide cyclase / dehydrase and lipid transport [Rhodococcus sp. MEB064]KQU02626.1 polyketide cyclase / dehydrase and lipid transport [Rhodococcus sp. Leaf7]KQU38098.1 polyketide cyclase / dehydrase and lipid transport [Rhodococcus sp. Leaf247]
MSSVQIADQTFLAAPASDVAELVGDTRRQRSWFPGLTLTVQEDRGEKGIRWTVAGELTGTMEVWLEPMLDGVVLHYFLHAEPVGVSTPDAHRRRVAGKTMSFEIKALLERGRAAGEPPVRAVR